MFINHALKCQANMLPPLLAGGEPRASGDAGVWAGSSDRSLVLGRGTQSCWEGRRGCTSAPAAAPGGQCQAATVTVSPRTAESPAVTSACWHPAAGITSSQTKHFCYSLTFHFQTSSKPAPQRPSLGPRGNISTPKLHFVPCVH